MYWIIDDAKTNDAIRSPFTGPCNYINQIKSSVTFRDGYYILLSSIFDQNHEYFSSTFIYLHLYNLGLWKEC